MDLLKLDDVFSVYTVDIDEVPEFTFMYELYDPFTLMLFHKSKPLMIDVGHSWSRKLTEFPACEDLARVLGTAVCEALELSTPATERGRSRPDGAPSVPGEQADDAVSVYDEAQRLADKASDWFSTAVEPVLDRSTEALRDAEERTWTVVENAAAQGASALGSAAAQGATALESARQQLMSRGAEWWTQGGWSGVWGGGGVASNASAAASSGSRRSAAR